MTLIEAMSNLFDTPSQDVRVRAALLHGALDSNEDLTPRGVEKLIVLHFIGKYLALTTAIFVVNRVYGQRTDPIKSFCVVNDSYLMIGDKAYELYNGESVEMCEAVLTSYAVNVVEMSAVVLRRYQHVTRLAVPEDE